MAASLLVFLYTFLRLGAWHGFVRMLLVLWMAAQRVLVAVAFLDPRLAATFARLSSIAIAGVGAALNAVPGAARPGPRAVAGADLDAAAGVAVRRRRHLHRPAGRRHRRVRPDRRAGADRRADRLHRHAVRVPLASSRCTARSPASSSCDRSPSTVPAPRCGNGTRGATRSRSARSWRPCSGSRPGELSAKADDFAKHMHPADRERFKLLLWSMKERAGGEMRIEFRMRHVDNSYRWFELEAAERALLRPPQPALRRPAARGDGRQARAGAAAAQCRARQPDRPAQPRAVPRPAGDRRQARHAGAAGPPVAAVHRHRQVQGVQHGVRPGGRRQPAADPCAPPWPQPRSAGHAGPHRRRSVRAAAAEPDRSARARHAGRAGAPLAALADQRSPARRSC